MAQLEMVHTDVMVEETSGGGLLSGVKLGDKSIDIQTEIFHSPKKCIISTAYFLGRLLLTEKMFFGNDKQNPLRLADVQHRALEAKIRNMLVKYLDRDQPEVPQADNLIPMQPCNEEDLFFKGYKAYELGDYAMAILYWEASLKADPDTVYLSLLLDMARERRARRKS